MCATTTECSVDRGGVPGPGNVRSAHRRMISVCHFLLETNETLGGQRKCPGGWAGKWRFAPPACTFLRIREPIDCVRIDLPHAWRDARSRERSDAQLRQPAAPIKRVEIESVEVTVISVDVLSTDALVLLIGDPNG